MPAQRQQLRLGVLARHARAVRPVGHHRVERVADGDDPRAERDRLAGEPVGVAAAVPALVAGAHERGDGAQRGHREQEALADERVAAHELPLGVVERAGLAQDRLRQPDLADVVQLGAVEQLGQRLLRHAEPAADGDGELPDVEDVVVQLGLALVQHADEHVARLAARRLRARVLARVHALVGEAQRDVGAVGLRRQERGAVRVGDREAVAGLA